MLPDHLLSWMIFFPLIGAGLIFGCPVVAHHLGQNLLCGLNPAHDKG